MVAFTRCWAVAGLVVLGLALSPDPAQPQSVKGDGAASQLPREVPGITVPDAFPQGCVDCHLRYPEQALDVRFSTLLSGWAREVEPGLMEMARSASRPGVTLVGRHPEVDAEVLSRIPRSCISCHTRRVDEAPDFPSLTHLIHLRGGGQNPFLSVFGAECTHCHKMDPDRGTWTVPSAAEKGEEEGVRPGLQLLEILRGPEEGRLLRPLRELWNAATRSLDPQ